MSIRLVTHCYARRLPQYAKHLQYQLSSLVLHRSSLPVAITICFSADDRATVDVLRVFQQEYQSDISIDPLPMSEASLFRRSIGRNKAALQSTEELVWFTDVDHVFHRECLDSLWEAWSRFKEKPVMVYPGKIKIHVDHDTGDQLVRKSESSTLLDIDPDDFVDKRYTRPIGGVQIVNGDYTRKYGYLSTSTRFQQPRTDGIPFGDFRDDVAFRNRCRSVGKIQRIDLPGLYRIRHSLTTYY